MDGWQGRWREIVLAIFVLLVVAQGVVPVAMAQRGSKPQGQQEEPSQYRDLLDNLLKDLDAPESKQAPDKTEGDLRGLLEGVVKSLGATAAQQGQRKSSDGCLSQIMLKSLLAGNTAGSALQAKTEALEKDLSDLLKEAQGKDWSKVLALANRALREESATKEWTLPLSRETFRAQVRSMRGTARQSQAEGGLADNLEAAIDDHSAALTEALKAPPAEAACAQELMTGTHMNLGSAYNRRVRGARADNLEKAIGHLEAALAALNPKESPHQWAGTQNNLGSTYIDRIRGKRADNIEQAITAFGKALTIWKREAFPAQWALLRHNLGDAYQHRVRGDRAQNIERAIEAFGDALTVRSREMPSGERTYEQAPLDALIAKKVGAEDPLGGFGGIVTAYAKVADVLGQAAGGPAILLPPDGWASSETDLGKVFLSRPTGDPADNIERAIASHRAALTLWTRDAYPVGWAAAKTNLGEAFASRIQGQRAENIELAIEAYREALSLRTRQAFPHDNLFTARMLGQALMAKRDWRGALTAFEEARVSTPERNCIGGPEQKSIAAWSKKAPDIGGLLAVGGLSPGWRRRAWRLFAAGVTGAWNGRGDSCRRSSRGCGRGG